MKPGGQQHVGAAGQAFVAGDGHAGEQLGLDAVGLEGVEPAQDRLDLDGLGGGHWVHEHGGLAVRRDPGQGRLGDVGVADDQPGVVQKRLLAGQELGGQVVVDLHVGHGQLHIPLFVGEEEVGGGGSAGHLQAVGQVNAQLDAGGGDFLSIYVVPQGGDHAYIQPQQGHVVGDVAAHAAQAHPHPAGVGILCHQFLTGGAADVHVHPAHHHCVGGGADDVALAVDVALFHQIGDVDGHRRAGDARPVGQLLLGDQGIFLNPLEDLGFPLGHGDTS